MAVVGSGLLALGDHGRSFVSAAARLLAGSQRVQPLRSVRSRAALHDDVPSRQGPVPPYGAFPTPLGSRGVPRRALQSSAEQSGRAKSGRLAPRARSASTCARAPARRLLRNFGSRRASGLKDTSKLGWSRRRSRRIRALVVPSDILNTAGIRWLAQQPDGD